MNIIKTFLAEISIKVCLFLEKKKNILTVELEVLYPTGAVQTETEKKENCYYNCNFRYL